MTHDPATASSPVSTDRAGLGAFLRSHYALGYLVLGALATYLYFSDHRAHFLGALPFLLLLACPLMHLFMHRGRGGHDSHAARRPRGGGGPK
ncbi:DUF2933 domain-containing protein [Ramlibacter sp. PS3R-8]|uniref:DUF2933 domain-containing protein n=1 Tax=Ramlibacter sp. PS3R-8 TaxID=3133437 RepID=UPI003099FA3E